MDSGGDEMASQRQVRGVRGSAGRRGRRERARVVFRLILLIGLMASWSTACSGETTNVGDRDSPTAEAGVEVVADHLEVPWGVAFLPDGDALVSERNSGRLLTVDPGGSVTEVGTVPDVAAEGEGGLLGIAVSPDFADDGLVFAYLTTADDNRIISFRLDDLAAGKATVTPVVVGIERNTVHNGGGLAFGPDGLLYAGTGDAGDSDHAQDTDSINGKILRMTPTGQPVEDNPIPGSLVYSWGHRNVQGLAWDSQGRLWATEFGQDTWDEVNQILPGNNYGWPLIEGQGDTEGGRFTNPEVVWSPAEASPSGAAIVHGTDGDTLYVAGLRGERLWQIPIRSSGLGEPVALLTGAYGRLRAVAATPDGGVWVTTSNRDGRGDPADDDDLILRLE